MDINLPGINGIEATRRITDAHPDATVLLLSTYQAADLPSGADSCGAAGYVNKEEFGPAVVLDIWSKRKPADPTVDSRATRDAQSSRGGCGPRSSCRARARSRR